MSKAINCKKLVAFALSSYSRLDPIFHKKAGRSLINCELTFLSNGDTRNQTKNNSCFFQQYNKNTLPLTESRKRKGVELNILLLCRSQHIRTGKAGISHYSAQHLKHF